MDIVLVETIAGHEDRSAGRTTRQLRERYQLPRDVAEARARKGLVKILHPVGKASQREPAQPAQSKAAGPAPENKQAGPAEENKGEGEASKAPYEAPEVGDLSTLTKPKLLELAAAYGLEVRDANNTPKVDIIAQLEEHRRKLASGE